MKTALVAFVLLAPLYLFIFLGWLGSALHKLVDWAYTFTPKPHRGRAITRRVLEMVVRP